MDVVVLTMVVPMENGMLPMKTAMKTSFWSRILNDARRLLLVIFEDAAASVVSFEPN